MEGVLDDVEEGGNRELPAVWAEDLAEDLAEGGEGCVLWVRGVERRVFLAGAGGVDAVEGDDEGY